MPRKKLLRTQTQSVHLPDNTTRIPLSAGKWVTISTGKFQRVQHMTWSATCIDGKWYAINALTQTYLHRLLMDAPDGYDIDHVNGVTLDCRDENLRVCTRSQNLRNRRKLNRNNTSGCTGVYWHADASKWVATIRDEDGEKIHLGYYTDYSTAVAARKGAERKLDPEYYPGKVGASQ